MSSDLQVDNQLLTDFLTDLLQSQVSENANTWLTGKLSSMKEQPATRDLYLVFSAIPRFLGHEELQLSNENITKAESIRSGFNLSGWTVSQAARVLTVCSFPYQDETAFLKIMDQLFSSAEVNELVALYSALPVMPFPEVLKNRASEGVRTNMSVVFDAVVLNNPYPSEYLDEGAWNQMVLKALFMGRPLYMIYGLEQRSNKQLSKMISDYAHERWAAKRSTSPEMWRPVGDQDTISIYEDLEHLLSMDDPDQQAAAVLSAIALDTKEAYALVDRHQNIADKVKQNNTTWDDIGKRWWSNQNLNN